MDHFILNNLDSKNILTSGTVKAKGLFLYPRLELVIGAPNQPTEQMEPALEIHLPKLQNSRQSPK